MYVREVEDQRLTFQVSGKLWMRSLVMRDIETETEWSHLLGRAMDGKLKGHRLKPIISDMVTWAVWKQQHPDTTVLNMSATSGSYTREFYREPEKFVFGFEVDGQAQALPMKQMLAHPVHHFQVGDIELLATFDRSGAVTHLFESTVDKQRLTFRAVDERVMTDQQTGSEWEVLSGRCIRGPLQGKLLKQRVGIMSFRTAWQNFHPESTDVNFEDSK